MRRMHWTLAILLGTLAGCQNGQLLWSDNRPLTSPAPADVQAEIRDARYFLAVPDQNANLPPSPIYVNHVTVGPSSN